MATFTFNGGCQIIEPPAVELSLAGPAEARPSDREYVERKPELVIFEHGVQAEFPADRTPEPGEAE